MQMAGASLATAHLQAAAWLSAARCSLQVPGGSFDVCALHVLRSTWTSGTALVCALVCLRA